MPIGHGALRRVLHQRERVNARRRPACVRGEMGIPLPLYRARFGTVTAPDRARDHRDGLDPDGLLVRC